MKKCPFCAEDIQDAAIKCKHCGEFLDGFQRPPPAPEVPSSAEPRLPWYYRTAFIVLMLASVGPFALPLVWLRPRLSPVWKIVISAATAVVTWYSCKIFMMSVRHIMQLYDMLNRM